MAEFLRILSVWSVLGGLIVSGSIIGWQTLQWLHFGIWIPITVLEAMTQVGLHYPRFEWVGVQEIADYLISCPLSGSVMFFSIALGFVMSAFSTAQEEVEREKMERKRQRMRENRLK